MKTCLLSALLLFSCYAYVAVGAPPQQQRGPNCRTHPTDLVFIIDSSRSVQPSEFERVKDFLSQVIESLDVGVNSTRVGVLNYASSVKNEFSLKTHKTKAALLQAVKKIQPLSTGTMTGLAIQYAINQAFTEGEGARLRSPGIKKVSKNRKMYTQIKASKRIKDVSVRARESGLELFAIGVGRVDMTTLRQIASEPLDEHVDYVESYKMYAVGVGNAVEDELRMIASEPVAEHYFYTADFKAMKEIGKKLQVKICVEENPCECEAIVKFQTKVEELIQSLTRKIEAVSKRLTALENKITV
ncbi:PREDICTED: cartilage matrix protein-like [Nanorana parkeri]|uniref:cartilage matrix protein-like n=1 Tax=Nanorana parkeri TaxID=125878 RepID=UPI000854EEBC|nr:PREDICTED: cartilage matrix protein-like [Nanorana parkeri]